MVEVPAGEFIMGTSLEDYNEFFWTYVEHDGHRHTAFVDEIPNFAVSLPGFSIDRLEVTNARYRRCIQTGVCPEPSPRSDLPDDYTTNPAYDDHPALVTELAARSYCQWGGKRLPTEAEWEKAARGTDGRLYPWGNERDDNRVAMELGPVGEHPDGASPYGALDMMGNAGEWTSDQYTLYPGAAQLSLKIPHMLREDLEYYHQAARGHPIYCQGDKPGEWRVTVRCPLEPEALTGFRCVAWPEPVSREEAMVQILASTPTPVPTLAPTSRPDLKKAAYIPAGEFIMGSDEGLEDPTRSDGPRHVVYLDAYYIDRTEVTVGQYVDFLNALLGKMGIVGLKQGCAGYPCSEWGDAKYQIVWRGEYLDVVDGEHVNYPMQYVGWHGASAYCRWVGGRLPTEAEWEKAARGTDGRRYPWGNTWRSELVPSLNDLAPVGSQPDNASPYGVLDMVGNVRELVADYYAEDYYSQSPYRNPQGPEWSSWGRVIRGTFPMDIMPMGLTLRRGLAPETPSWGMGFRCAYDVRR
jgi:formylglycine-generating enzyme required for sulfatase activity